MASAPDSFQLPQGLRDVILSGKCVAFVGSGVSSGCYDSWHDLINGLCERCGAPSRISYNSTGEQLLKAAQDAQDTNEAAYYAYLGERFGRAAQRAPLLYDAILSLPFDSYLTVNFDPLLALKSRTSRRPCDGTINAYPSLDRRAMGNGSVHYLHGFVEEGSAPGPGTIVLSCREFREAYEDNSNLMNFLVPMLENDPVVFLGCRLKEPDMSRVFAICKLHQRKRLRVMEERGDGRSTPPLRYILLAKPEVRDSSGAVDYARSEAQLAEQDAYYREMDITPEWYAAQNGDHSWLRFALEHLAELPRVAADYGW